MATTLRQASRAEYARRDETGHINGDELRNGSLQRIADAVEKMAVRHTELIDQRDRYERMYTNERSRREAAQRHAAALRGVITRLKKAHPKGTTPLTLTDRELRLLKQAVETELGVYMEQATEEFADDQAVLNGLDVRLSQMIKSKEPK